MKRKYCHTVKNGYVGGVFLSYLHSFLHSSKNSVDRGEDEFGKINCFAGPKGASFCHNMKAKRSYLRNWKHPDKFFFFFCFWPHPWHMKFPGQWWNPSCSCNARSLTHCAVLGIKPAPRQRPKPLQRQQQILNPLRHSGNSNMQLSWRSTTFFSL